MTIDLTYLFNCFVGTKLKIIPETTKYSAENVNSDIIKHSKKRKVLDLVSTFARFRDEFCTLLR